MAHLVDVHIVTYNHEKFIAKCLDSILSQKTDFDVRIIVGDDHSTDKTQEILLSYKERYPNKFLLQLHKENLGPKYLPGLYNFLGVMRAIEAPYVAMIEGDDFWTDDHKLQTQVDYLIKNPQAAGCFHDSVLLDENEVEIRQNYYSPNKHHFNQEECLKKLRSAFATCSLLFRKKCIENLPKWYTEWTSDFALDLLITEKGELHYIKSNMSAYRMHSGGIWSGKNDADNFRQVINRFKVLYNDNGMRLKYGEYLRLEIEKHMRELAWLFFKENKSREARKAYWNYLKFKRPIKSKEFLIYIKHFLLKL